MSEHQLLKILSDGQYHSGEDLGNSLGISRAAIWKQLKKIESLGIELESIKGKGYCLKGGLSLLSEAEILSAMTDSSRQQLIQMDVETVIDSTNVAAMSFAQNNTVYPYVCTAEQQTGGKGRRGREWFSPYGRNLYFSITWEFAGGAASLEGLSLAVGVVVADVLAEYGADQVQLKWPNDILYDGKKLAGILLEMTGDAAGPCQVVVGVGLNVAMSGLDTDSIDQPWVDLESVLKTKVVRSELQGKLLSGLFGLLSEYEAKSFAAYKQRFTERDVHLGKPVYVKLSSRVVIGESAGITDSGALLLNTEAGQEQFNGGEVSLRGADAT